VISFPAKTQKLPQRLEGTCLPAGRQRKYSTEVFYLSYRGTACPELDSGRHLRELLILRVKPLRITSRNPVLKTEVTVLFNEGL